MYDFIAQHCGMHRTDITEMSVVIRQMQSSSFESPLEFSPTVNPSVALPISRMLNQSANIVRKACKRYFFNRHIFEPAGETSWDFELLSDISVNREITRLCLQSGDRNPAQDACDQESPCDENRCPAVLILWHEHR